MADRRHFHGSIAIAAAGAMLATACASQPIATANHVARPSLPTNVSLGAIVHALAVETAAIRGLSLDREVPVSVQSPAQIIAHVRDDLAEDRDEIETEAKLGVAMGMLPAGIDLLEVLARFVGTEAQGYYDPSSARLVITEHDAQLLATPGPEGLDARATVVHELVHALQHQHFAARVEEDDSHAPALSDAARARLALLEGDATLVAMEWTQRRRGGRLLGASDMEARVARWTDNAQVLTEADVPSYIVESTEMPYEAGVRGVAALYRSGGFGRVDAVLATVGVSAADVLHPDRAARTPVDVPDPDAMAMGSQHFERVAVRTLGEMELRLQLGRVMRSERAASLAATWRGDRVALYEHAGTLAVRWVLACEDEPHARAIAEAFRPLWERWQRDGCPGIAGGGVGRCPSHIDVDGSHVTIARGG